MANGEDHSADYAALLTLMKSQADLRDMNLAKAARLKDPALVEQHKRMAAICERFRIALEWAIKDLTVARVDQ